MTVFSPQKAASSQTLEANDRYKITLHAANITGRR